jgi:methylglutaconyl-CoA hydratase
MTATLDITRTRHVARVYLNRPKVRNAFNAAVIGELTAAFLQLGTDSELRAIVLGGHGKAFCAGADLEWMREMADFSWDENRADAQALADMLWAIYRCPIPIVGRIHGDCYAGGVGLAAVCDIVVADKDIGFCLSEARLGLIPATIGPYVIRALGEQAARRYFITAERFDARTAKADEIVAALVGNGPAALRACKRLVQDFAGKPIDDALRTDSVRRIAGVRASHEGKEGVQSFLNKRAPSWLASST